MRHHQRCSRGKVPRDVKFQTDKQLLASQPDTVVVNKETAGLIDEAIPAGSSIRKKEHGEQRGGGRTSNGPCGEGLSGAVT